MALHDAEERMQRTANTKPYEVNTVPDSANTAPYKASSVPCKASTVPYKASRLDDAKDAELTGDADYHTKKSEQSQPAMEVV